MSERVAVDIKAVARIDQAHSCVPLYGDINNPNSRPWVKIYNIDSIIKEFAESLLSPEDRTIYEFDDTRDLDCGGLFVEFRLRKNPLP